MVGIIDVIGWIGAILLLIAYWAGVQKRLPPDGVTYNLLNAVGSLAIGVNVLANQAYPSVVLNAVWLAVALHALLAKRKA